VSKLVSEPGAVATGSNNSRETWWSGRYRSRFWHGLWIRRAIINHPLLGRRAEHVLVESL